MEKQKEPDLKPLNNMSSFLDDRIKSAEKVIKETDDTLKKQGWEGVDKELEKVKKEKELLAEGKKPSEVLEIMKELYPKSEEQKAYEKELLSYLDKNPKGRDDIPCTTRR